MTTNCGVCSRPLRSDNRSLLCAKCRLAHHTLDRCACGCGRFLNSRNRLGIAKPCAMRLTMTVGRKLAEAARTGDPRTLNLLAAFRRLGEVPVSQLRFDSFGRALAAYDAPVSTLLGGPYTGGPTP